MTRLGRIYMVFALHQKWRVVGASKSTREAKKIGQAHGKKHKLAHVCIVTRDLELDDYDSFRHGWSAQWVAP